MNYDISRPGPSTQPDLELLAAREQHRFGMGKRAVIAATALTGWFGLLLQFPISIATSRAAGMSMIGAVLTYLSFFTILTNLLAALALTVSWWPKSHWGGFFSRPIVTSGLATHMAMVGIVYALLLRHTWDPEGLQKIADMVLHDIAPVMFFGCWLIALPKARLSWKNVLFWLLYPLIYLGFILSRGALTRRYPYPFIDAGKLGYPLVLANATALVIAFLVLGLLVLAIGRWMSSHKVAQRT